MHIIYKVCSESIQLCNMKETFIEEDARFKKHCAWDNDASVPFKAGTLGPHTVLPVSLLLFKTLCKILWWNHHQLSLRIFLNCINGLKSLPFQRWFQFWEKPEVTGHQIWAVVETESPGRFDVSPKNSAWNMMHERALCRDEAANHQVPTAVAFWISRIVSMEECSSLTQNLRQIRCSTHSVILNVMATQYTCSLNSVYCPTD